MLQALQTDMSSIRLEDFIDASLYDEKSGYYANSGVIGKLNDFITAPHISPLFSHCLAQWCLDQWLNAGAPTPLNLIEFGSGTGIMLKDMLDALKKAPQFYGNLTCFIIEKSNHLKTIQKDTLKDHPCIHWLGSHDDISADFSIVVANEFFDALPVQYYRNNGDVVEAAFVADSKQIKWQAIDLKGLAREDRLLFMRSVAYSHFTDKIAEILFKNGGLGLIIDYGSMNPGFTLQAIRQHKKVGIFDCPGEADLTHHVDFSYLINLFKAKGLRVLGPQTQGAFLKDLGIDRLLEQLKAKSSPQIFTQQALAVHRLISSAEMGELFKVIALQGDPNGC